MKIKKMFNKQSNSIQKQLKLNKKYLWKLFKLKKKTQNNKKNNNIKSMYNKLQIHQYMLKIFRMHYYNRKSLNKLQKLKNNNHNWYNKNKKDYNNRKNQMK